MPLGMKVGIGPVYIVLDGDTASPLPPPERGTAAPPSLFGGRLLWSNGKMDQGATWYKGRPWLR